MKRQALRALAGGRLERDEAKDLRDWLTAKGYEFDEAPRGNSGFVRNGLAKGRPDFLVLTITIKSQRPVAIELKRADGGSVTPEQVAKLNRYRRAGWHTAICFGAESAITELTRLGY